MEFGLVWLKISRQIAPGEIDSSTTNVSTLFDFFEIFVNFEITWNDHIQLFATCHIICSSSNHIFCSKNHTLWITLIFCTHFAVQTWCVPLSLLFWWQFSLRVHFPTYPQKSTFDRPQLCEFLSPEVQTKSFLELYVSFGSRVSISWSDNGMDLATVPPCPNTWSKNLTHRDFYNIFRQIDIIINERLLLPPPVR